MAKSKTIFTLLLAAALALVFGSAGSAPAQASGHQGKIIRMSGLSSLYYVAGDGKRYVFPNEKTFNSWFPDFTDVTTLSESDITALPLGGNVLYRPGVVLIKITTDPKVYAVARGGVLRWVKTENIAKSLYGDNWNKLVDDVPDSFFTNYTVGDVIDSILGFNPDTEAAAVDSIDANHNLANANALRARTRKCRIIGNDRDCRADSSAGDSVSDDTTAPYITKITANNRGQKGYIDADDQIVITFNEAIDPASVNPSLTAEGEVNSLDTDTTGAITVLADGTITVNDIASFDLGAVADTGKMAVRLNLSSNAKVLTITVISGNSVRIDDEDFDTAAQIGGYVKDPAGNVMADDPDIGTPDGTFGGVNVNDGIPPYIRSIKAYNNGAADYIDTGDEIAITFSEEIDPRSINTSLIKNGSVDNVRYNKTGGVTLAKNGLLVVTHIATFFTGDVADNSDFDVLLALDSTGKILTITLTSGDNVAVTNETLDSAAQTGGYVEDRDGNKMDDDPKIDNPLGSFTGESAGSELYISYAKAYNDGYAGYIDEGDRIVITFSQPVSPNNFDSYAEFNETGGVWVDADGLLTVTDIMSFDVGDVAAAGQFEVKLALDASRKILTITLYNGDPVKIDREVFSAASQTGGFIVDETGDFVMAAESGIDAPAGTFGGDSVGSAPYITAIAVANHGQAGHIDAGDTITITFSEGIEPYTINNGLDLDDYVRNVDNNDTGGVTVGSDGTLTIADIAEFSIGDVADNTSFDVKLALNKIGNVLTITLETGDTAAINYQDLSDASQIGGTLKDTDGKTMENDPRIDDPTGSF